MTMVTVAESLVCPPPPSDSALNEEAISSLIVPAPKWNKVRIWLMMVIGHTYHLYMENMSVVSCIMQSCRTTTTSSGTTNIIFSREKYLEGRITDMNNFEHDIITSSNAIRIYDLRILLHNCIPLVDAGAHL